MSPLKHAPSSSNAKSLFPAEKIWRALTQPHLIEEWLMKNDFKPTRDHRFTLRGDWGSVDCKVLAVEPYKTLSYTWDAMGLESTVTWTITPTGAGDPSARSNNPASGRISSRPIRARNMAGRSSSAISTRRCRG